MNNYRIKLKIIVTIADVHIGNSNISPDEYKYQLKNGILNKLEQMAFTDGIVLCGDTLHTKLPLNSEYSNIFFWFIAKLVKIAKEKGAFIRILRGTKSHDIDQLDNVQFYEDELDFKVINTKYEEEIDGHKYAYIPEEYIADTKEYYKEILEKPDEYYDMLFMHGTIVECQFIQQESENHNTKAPVFTSTELIRVCKGPVSAGHIHTPMNIKDRFFYIGSALRTCHGEEHDKGFNIITYIQEQGVYRVDKIVNEFTFNFNTLKIDAGFIDNHNVDEIVDYVNDFRKRNNTDKLSLKITCVDHKETTAKIQLLKKYFGLDKYITTHFKIMSQQAYEKEVERQMDKVTKPYLQKGLTLIDQIRLWALEERSVRLKDTDIERFITDRKLKREGID